MPETGAMAPSDDEARVATAPPPVDPNRDLICGGCRYNLKGIASDRCPECGRLIDRAHLTLHLIPWEQRRDIGKIAAFLRMIWRGMFDVPALAAHAQRPVSYAAAVRFRLVLVFWVGLLGALALGWAILNNSSSSPLGRMTQFEPLEWEQALWLFFLNPISFGVSLIALWIWLWLATGINAALVPLKGLSIEQQNRAMALAQYSCAPLALLPLVFLMCQSDALRNLFRSSDAWAGQLTISIGTVGIILALLAFVSLRRRPPLRPRPALRAIVAMFGAISLVIFLVGVFACWRGFTALPEPSERSLSYALLMGGIGGVALSLLPWLWSLLNPRTRMLPMAAVIGAASLVMFAAGAMLAWMRYEATFQPGINQVGMVATLGVLALWWVNGVRLMARLNPESARRGRVGAVAILLPVIWLALGVAVESSLLGIYTMAQIVLGMR
jgi:hypothetical protein